MGRRKIPLPDVEPEQLPELVTRLAEVQRCGEWTDDQFGGLLGLDRGVWAGMKVGRIDLTFLPGVAQLFPQWAWMVQRFLQGLDGALPAVDVRERVKRAREAWDEGEGAGANHEGQGSRVKGQGESSTASI